MARAATKEKTTERGIQMQATVPHELGTALEDWGWSNRKLKTAVVRQALEEFAANHDIQVSPAPEEGQPEG